VLEGSYLVVRLDVLDDCECEVLMEDVVKGDYRMSQTSTGLGVTMLLNMRLVVFSLLPSYLAIRA